MNMIHIPARGSLPECWINCAHIVSIYYTGNKMYIELKRTTTVIQYESDEAAQMASNLCIKGIAGSIVTVPDSPVAGDIINNKNH